MISRKYIQVLLIGLLVVLSGTGCDNTFEPLEEGGEHNFTMYGALDLHADTQWVRVMPIGERLIPRSTENNAKVELIREETGETIVMNDSLFLFGGDARVFNYWTTEMMHPEEEYTVRAESKDGEQSSAARVSIPSPLPRPTVEVIDEYEGIVRGTSSSPLVTADLKICLQLVSEVGTVSSKREYKFSLLDKVRRDANGEYFFNYSIDGLLFQELNRRSGYIVVDMTLVLIKSSEDWPDISGLSELEIGIPNIASNIEKGTGFVAGVARREMPLKSCYDDQENLIPCQDVQISCEN